MSQSESRSRVPTAELIVMLEEILLPSSEVHPLTDADRRALREAFDRPLNRASTKCICDAAEQIGESLIETARLGEDVLDRLQFLVSLVTRLEPEYGSSANDPKRAAARLMGTERPARDANPAPGTGLSVLDIRSLS